MTKKLENLMILTVLCAVSLTFSVLSLSKVVSL